MESIITVLVLLIAVAISWPWRRHPDVDLGPARPRTRRLIDLDQLEEQLADAVINGTPGSLTTREVRSAISEIVNSGLSNKEQYVFLDALEFKTINNHADGMAADVLEEITNEITHLEHPDWHGRHGNWTSLKS